MKIKSKKTSVILLSFFPLKLVHFQWSSFTQTHTQTHTKKLKNDENK